MSEPEREDAPPPAAEGGDAPPAGGDEPRGEGDRSEGAQYDRPPRREGPPDITNMFSLRVTNLSYETSRQTIRNMFEDTTPGAEITDVYIPRDRATGQPRGFAFVRYREKAAAEDVSMRHQGAAARAPARAWPAWPVISPQVPGSALARLRAACMQRRARMRAWAPTCVQTMSRSARACARPGEC